jgi:predicted RND superfamily exporter protein
VTVTQPAKNRVGDIVVRISDAVTSRAWVTLVLSWLVAVAAVVVMTGLQVHGDFASLLPPDTKSVKDLHALEARTRVLADYMVGVEANDPAQRATAAQVMRAELEKLDPALVSGITADERAPRQFTWNNRFLYAPLEDVQRARDALDQKIAEANPLYVSLDDDDDGSGKEAPPTADDFEKRLDEAEARSKDPGAFVSKDGHLQLFIVRTTFTADDDRGQVLTTDLQHILDKVQKQFPAVQVGMAGDVINTTAEHKSLIRGVVASTVITVGLVLGALFLFYRSVAGLGALSWSLTVGVLCTFAVTRLTIGSLNLASSFLSSIVIGNGINFGMVLLARYGEERQKHPDPKTALHEAVRGAAPGTLAAALTASVAYISLAVTPFRGFRDFGIIGAAGMMLCWVSAFTVLPAALTVVGRHVNLADPARFGKVLARIVPRRPRTVTAIGLAILVLTTSATVRYLTNDPLEDNLNNLRSENHDLDNENQWMSKFDKAFGSGISGGFAIGTSSREEAHDVATKLEAADEGKPDSKHLFSRINTLEDALPKDQQKKLALLAEVRDMLDGHLFKHLSEEDQARFRKLRPPDDLRALTEDDLPNEMAWPFTEKDDSRGKLVLANTGHGVDEWRITSLVDFAAQLRALKFPPDVVIGGTAFIFSDMLAAMVRDGPRATAAAIIGSALVVLLLLGWGRYARVTLACAGLGITGMLSVAWLMGIKVNFLDFVALPITIGIGVDYGVNIAARARLSRDPHPGFHALSTTGPVVALCSYTTVVGYASLLFSQNKGIHTFGQSAMIGELTCLTAALVLAPALLDFGVRARSGYSVSGSTAT